MPDMRVGSVTEALQAAIYLPDKIFYEGEAQTYKPLRIYPEVFDSAAYERFRDNYKALKSWYYLEYLPVPDGWELDKSGFRKQMTRQELAESWDTPSPEEVLSIIHGDA